MARKRRVSPRSTCEVGYLAEILQRLRGRERVKDPGYKMAAYLGSIYGAKKTRVLKQDSVEIGRGCQTR